VKGWDENKTSEMSSRIERRKYMRNEMLLLTIPRLMLRLKVLVADLLKVG